jgi:hypothetical protein
MERGLPFRAQSDLRARQSRPPGGEGDGGPHNSTCGPSPYRLVTTPPFVQPCGPQLVGTALVAVTLGGQPTDCCVAEVLAQPPHSASEKSDGSGSLGMDVVPRKHGSQMVWQPRLANGGAGVFPAPPSSQFRSKSLPLLLRASAAYSKHGTKIAASAPNPGRASAPGSRQRRSPKADRTRERPASP